MKQDITALRHAIGVQSDGFEISESDYKELLIFSNTANYEEFQQACDNINCKYPTGREFENLLSAVRAQQEIEEGDTSQAMIDQCDKAYASMLAAPASTKDVENITFVKSILGESMPSGNLDFWFDRDENVIIFASHKNMPIMISSEQMQAMLQKFPGSTGAFIRVE